MDQVIKDRWVEALRSGGYERAGGVLRDDRGRFCALGILCDLAAKDGVGHWKRVQGAWVFESGGIGGAGLLPVAVAKWAGIDAAHPTAVWLQWKGRRVGVSSLSDGNTPFEEIADLIQEQL